MKNFEEINRALVAKKTLSNSAFMRGLTAKRSVSISGLTVTLLAVLAICATACNKIDPKNDPITYGETYISHLLSTDKAAYQPGETVRFTLNAMPENGAVVCYKHLGKTLAQENVTSLNWSWQLPATDFQGYMAELHTRIDGKDSVYATVGIDCSSEPSRFPRNGFLSSYGAMSQREINTVIESLNRYHINYLQFQDWHWKHHHPLGGTANLPMEVWTDIISRNCYRATVQGYIDAAHKRGMLTLFYNLGYGALEDYATDGVNPEWMLFTDTRHQTPDFHPLGSPFKSAIYLANTNSDDWRAFLSDRNDEVYAVFDFDGWQIDQLGVRPSAVYDYYGAPVDLAASFGSFISDMKKAQPSKRLVMNAVGQYGQQGQIASSPVDFCYTEVWEHSNTKGYDIFRQIINDNAAWSNGKQTVLAAYLNYNYGQKGRGWFNTPGILMATAVANAWGGTILQLGEHMLCHEYFPGDNLSMTGELKRAMISYYDFAVAYENLLRPEVPAAGINTDWYGVDVVSKDGKCTFNQWPPVQNQVATVGRHVQNCDVIHLLSYSNATHLDWCDEDADQGEPARMTGLSVSIPVSAQPTRVWFASPDYRQGASQNLAFEYANGAIQLTIPSLKYYSMLVVEY